MWYIWHFFHLVTIHGFDRQTDWQTDGQTDRRTAFSWLYGVAFNACSAVIKLNGAAQVVFAAFSFRQQNWNFTKIAPKINASFRQNRVTNGSNQYAKLIGSVLHAVYWAQVKQTVYFYHGDFTDLLGLIKSSLRRRGLLGLHLLRCVCVETGHHAMKILVQRGLGNDAKEVVND